MRHIQTALWWLAFSWIGLFIATGFVGTLVVAFMNHWLLGLTGVVTTGCATYLMWETR